MPSPMQHMPHCRASFALFARDRHPYSTRTGGTGGGPRFGNRPGRGYTLLKPRDWFSESGTIGASHLRFLVARTCSEDYRRRRKQGFRNRSNRVTERERLDPEIWVIRWAARFCIWSGCCASYFNFHVDELLTESSFNWFPGSKLFAKNPITERFRCINFELLGMD